MMSYLNKDGEQIHFSDEQLREIVKIKLDLQNASPSRKCNWKQLKEICEAQGIDGIEVSEGFRCLVKRFQANIGELPNISKYKNLVQDSKIDAAKALLGDIAFEKRETQLMLRELNRAKREVCDWVTLADEIRETMLDDIEYNIPALAYQDRLPSTKKKMICCLSDLHIGALVENVNGNNFNYDIALKRLDEYAKRVISEAKMYGITEVDVVNLGDSIEHIGMRFNMGFGVEFTLGEQVVKAGEAIIKFIVNLSEHLNVNYFGISGNHDRSDGRKDMNVEGDSVMIPINSMIETFINMSNIKRLSYEKCDTYDATKDYNGKLIKFVHGDRDSINDKWLLAKHTMIDEKPISAIVMGHFHHYSVKEIGDSKMQITFGSLKGNDEYSKKLKLMAAPSQGIIVVHEDGEIEPKKFSLNIA